MLHIEYIDYTGRLCLMVTNKLSNASLIGVRVVSVKVVS